MNIVYIHGNRATAGSFNFIRSRIGTHPETMIEYDSSAGFYRNHDNMLDQLDGMEDIFFIAHSLGGVHALHLAHHLGNRVAGGVTISTPYGGSAAASVVACFMPFSQLMKDICPNGRPIVEAGRMETPRFWTNIVTIAGASPFILEPNDGVITLESMRHRKDIRLVNVESNHFEVVLNEQTVDVIERALHEVSEAQAELNLMCA